MYLWGYISAIGYGLLCLLLAFVAYKLGMPKKYSRKLVHILVGAEWIILWYFMGPSYHFLIVCLAFTALLLVAHLKKLMPMISSDSDNAPGTVYYGVAMSIMAFICLFVKDLIVPFGIGVFATSVGDGFAGIIGQAIRRFNPKIYKNKSLFGSLANFVFSSLTAIVFKFAFDLPLAIWQCLAIGVFAVGIELITEFGLDNITITVGVAFLSYLFIRFDVINGYVIPIIVTPFVIAAVLQKKVLTRNGLILAMILDAVVSLILGNFGFVLLCVFLFGSVLIDKIKKRKKADDGITKKGDCRDGIQVIANGLVPMVMALLYSATSHHAFLVGYVAALSEAFADTAASGLGVFSKKVFDLFRFKPTRAGLSGGMTVIGTVASLGGAVIVSFVAFAFGVIDIYSTLISAGAAFLGAIFDSFLGSLLQIKYRCPKCNEITERDIHCDIRGEKYSGFAFFDNDVVNLLSGVFSAALATTVILLII